MCNERSTMIYFGLISLHWLNHSSNIISGSSTAFLFDFFVDTEGCFIFLLLLLVVEFRDKSRFLFVSILELLVAPLIFACFGYVWCLFQSFFLRFWSFADQNQYKRNHFQWKISIFTKIIGFVIVLASCVKKINCFFVKILIAFHRIS